MTNLSIPEVNIEGQAKEDDQAGDSRTAVPPEAPVGGEGEAATVGGGTAGQPVASKSTCRRCWDKAGVFMRDVRTERAIRSSAAVGVLCVLSTAFPVGCKQRVTSAALFPYLRPSDGLFDATTCTPPEARF